MPFSININIILNPNNVFVKKFLGSGFYDKFFGTLVFFYFTFWVLKAHKISFRIRMSTIGGGVCFLKLFPLKPPSACLGILKLGVFLGKHIMTKASLLSLLY